MCLETLRNCLHRVQAECSFYFKSSQERGSKTNKRPWSFTRHWLYPCLLHPRGISHYLLIQSRPASRWLTPPSNSHYREHCTLIRGNNKPLVSTARKYEEASARTKGTRDSVEKNLPPYALSCLSPPLCQSFLWPLGKCSGSNCTAKLIWSSGDKPLITFFLRGRWWRGRLRFHVRHFKVMWVIVTRRWLFREQSLDAGRCGHLCFLVLHPQIVAQVLSSKPVTKICLCRWWHLTFLCSCPCAGLLSLSSLLCLSAL